MTFEEKITQLLVENGLFDDQAKEIMELVKADQANEAMQNRWNDDTEGYPGSVLAVLWVGVKNNRAGVD